MDGDAALRRAVERFLAALRARMPEARFGPFVPPAGARIIGQFEVRSADGHVRRMQEAELPLPAPLLRAFSHGAAPAAILALERPPKAVGRSAEPARLTLWPPEELIELQVGHRWHGFTGKRIAEWDERYMLFAEQEGDPVALRLDEEDGPVWSSRRGEGRHRFFPLAPSLAALYEALAREQESLSR